MMGISKHILVNIEHGVDGTVIFDEEGFFCKAGFGKKRFVEPKLLNKILRLNFKCMVLKGKNIKTFNIKVKASASI